MTNEGDALQSVRKVKSEDFTTINPMAIWEAEKRLFYLPLVNLSDQVEAVQYLKSNRLDFSYQYIREKCLQFDTQEYSFDDQSIPIEYINPWFAPWVESVKIFWNRIEYILAEPNKEKHEAFRKSCTSTKAFNAAQRFSVDSSKPFPVEKLKTLEDVPALSHEYDESSPFGIVYLDENLEGCKKISYTQNPFWIWDDEVVLFVWSEDQDYDNYLNKKARDESTKRQIDFLNGFWVSEKVFDFIRMYCLSDLSTIISLEKETYLISKDEKRFASDLNGRVHILKQVCEIIEMFNKDYSDILTRLLSRSEWLKNIFEVGEQ